MKTSIFEIFRVWIGPSSSHTVGPMRAASDFVAILASKDLLIRTHRVLVELYGSLALTGRGHGTDGAILLGLCGELPDRIDPETIESRLRDIRSVRGIALRGVCTIPFAESEDLLFHKDQTLPGHSNGMRFRAFDADGKPVFEQVYYSIGGGVSGKKARGGCNRERCLFRIRFRAPMSYFASATSERWLSGRSFLRTRKPGVPKQRCGNTYVGFGRSCKPA